MMKKTILCLVMALCLCLCMILVSCKPDDDTTDTPPEEIKGQFHTTPDNTAGVEYEADNPLVDGWTTRQ